MSRKTIATNDAPSAIGPYSQGVVSGSFLYCSGQLGINPSNGQLGKDVKEQAELSMKNLKAIIEKAGSSMENIVKTTIFLINMSDFAAVNEVYGAFFPGEKPARSTIAVAALPKAGLVEIEAVVAL